MRTKVIKINGVKKDAMLVAGGQGFKIYSVIDFDGWVLSHGKSISFIDDCSSEAQTVADYVNIQYQSLDTHPRIREKFNLLLSTISHQQKSLHQEA